MNSKLIEKAAQLQKEAIKILRELDLLKILKTISKPEIVGSVANGLIVAKDIDIHAYVEEYDIHKILNLLPKLGSLPTIQKVQLNNYRDFRRDYHKNKAVLPHAYYVGLRSIKSSGEWKIDIWFANKEDIEEFDIRRLQNLSQQKRLTILKLKDAWYTDEGYKDGTGGVDIYKAVLEKDVKTQQEFKRYLASKKRATNKNRSQ